MSIRQIVYEIRFQEKINFAFKPNIISKNCIQKIISDKPNLNSNSVSIKILKAVTAVNTLTVTKCQAQFISTPNPFSHLFLGRKKLQYFFLWQQYALTLGHEYRLVKASHGYSTILCQILRFLSFPWPRQKKKRSLLRSFWHFYSQINAQDSKLRNSLSTLVTPLPPASIWPWQSPQSLVHKEENPTHQEWQSGRLE